MFVNDYIGIIGASGRGKFENEVTHHVDVIIFIDYHCDSIDDLS